MQESRPECRYRLKDMVQTPVLRILIASTLLLVASCVLHEEREPGGIGNKVDWQQIEGWHEDRMSETWPALVHNCSRLGTRKAWKPICDAAGSLPDPSDDQAREFYETWFVAHELHGQKNRHDGLMTGYYEPLLFGSMSRDRRYRHPIYREPDDLLKVDLGSLYPDLKGKRVRGRIQGKSVVPYYSRAQIESDLELLEGSELLWLDDRDDVFFLHIQGSGRVQMDDGTTVGVGYANQNGHPYVAIGRILLEWGELEREDISLFTIRQWLRDHPEQAVELLNRNPSYVFFNLRPDVSDGPIGSLNVPLTPQRSIAIDPALVPLGSPMWIQTNLPGQPDVAYRRLVIAQDTGGAIKGPLRGDLFWGHGPEAEQQAGIMKERVRMLVLLPARPEE